MKKLLVGLATACLLAGELFGAGINPKPYAVNWMNTSSNAASARILLGLTTDGSNLVLNTTGNAATASSVSNRNTLYVRTWGNNSTAVRGQSGLPWVGVQQAASNLLAGDTLDIGPGNFQLVDPGGDGFIVCPTNVTIRGAGMYATKLLGTSAGAVTAGILLRNGMKLNDFSMTNYGAPLLSYDIGNGMTSFTNVEIQNCEFYGYLDAFFLTADSPCFMVCRNSRFLSHFDIMADSTSLGTPPPGLFEFYDCYLWSDGAGSGTPTTVSGLDTFQSVKMYNCFMNRKIQVYSAAQYVEIGGSVVSSQEAVDVNSIGNGNFTNYPPLLNPARVATTGTRVLKPSAVIYEAPIYASAVTNVNWNSNNVYCGQVVWPALMTTYRITNAVVTANTVVFGSVQSDDATFNSAKVVCTTGLMTWTAVAPPTSNTKFCWLIVSP